MHMSPESPEYCKECGGMGSHVSGEICNVCDGAGTVTVEPGDQDACECCGGPASECTCPPGCPGCSCRSSMEEGVSFDKFMDTILVKEGSVVSRKMRTLNDSPQRERARKHQEKPLNRITYRGQR